jgi:hypothetical protein
MRTQFFAMLCIGMFWATGSAYAQSCPAIPSEQRILHTLVERGIPENLVIRDISPGCRDQRVVTVQYSQQVFVGTFHVRTSTQRFLMWPMEGSDERWLMAPISSPWGPMGSPTEVASN